MTLRYRLAPDVETECVPGHDNGKGDRRRAGTKEMPFVYVSLDQQFDDR